MRAPNDFGPQLVNTSSMPYAAPPAWLRSQRFPDNEVFAQADRHAMEVAQCQHDSFKDLLFHLAYTENWSEVEVARVLFRWMTAKSMYAIEFAGAPPGTPEELIMGFKDGKSTYCRIFELLCLYSGIPCITVVGHAKGIEFRPGMQFQGQRYNHSWNAVFIEGSWQLIDCHWATRYLQSNDCNVPENMVYEYDDFYFCPDPEGLVYSHFPDDPKWQLLKQPLSMYDFEDLPIAKSAFFKNDLRFLSHHRGVIPTERGCVSLSLGNCAPLSFTFKLLYGESCKDELGGVKLTRYGIQETKDGQVNMFIRAPVKGFYYLTVYAAPIKQSGIEESIFNAVCEYKLICDTPYPNVEPYPFASDTNWGPGAEAYQAGLIPNCRDAVIVAHDGHIELDFEKVRPVKVLPKLSSSRANERQCEEAIKQDDNDYITRLDVDLPANGEYALEIYVNDPARDGNTYTHVCQYLLVKPERGDNTDALFYQTPNYNDCYNVYGLQEPLKPVNMSLEELARGMQDNRMVDNMASEPRPAAKHAAMKGVEVEQITVSSPKPKSGVSSKPSTGSMGKGEKPTPAAKPGKPAPKPKPKPGGLSSSGSVAPNYKAEWSGSGNVGHASDDYANLPGRQGKPGQYGDEPGSAGYSRGPHGSYGDEPGYTGSYGNDPQGRYVNDPQGQYANEPQGHYGNDPQGYYGDEPGSAGYGRGPKGSYGDEPGYTGTYGNDPQGYPGGDPQGYYGVEPGSAGYGKGPKGSFGDEPGSAGYGRGGQDGRQSGMGQGPYGDEYNQSGAPGYGGRPQDGNYQNQPYDATYTSQVTRPGQHRPGGQPDRQYNELGYPIKGNRGADEYGGKPSGEYSQEDMERHGRDQSGVDDMMMAGDQQQQFAGQGPRSGKHYSQSSLQGGDDDFPAPPPASDMLNMEFAPERSQSEVPTAPKTFNPIHIADYLKRKEVDPVQMAHVPKPAPAPAEENLVFSAERAQQFKTVDTHAVQVAKTEHNSFRDLIWDLIYSKNITDDLEKARVIFLWLCTKDLGKMQFRNVQAGSPEEILLSVKQGKATYAQIYETLCSYAGLHCRVIRGYAKGADYKPGMRFHGSTAFHAWNGVLIHGYWRLIDCHWASRRMFGKKGTEHIRYELDDYYFCVEPRQLIYTHFPEDKQWQLLQDPYSLPEFEDMPLVKSLFFRYCLQLESHTSAIIQTNDQFMLTVNYQYYRGPGLEFTCSIHTNEGEEVVNGLKLSRYAVQDIIDTKHEAKVHFWIRPPTPGLYKFAVYAREVQAGEANRMYCAVAEYMLDVDNSVPHMEPFPECSSNSWGITPASAKKRGVSTKATSGIIYTQNGQAEIRFRLHKQLLFSAKLKSNHYPEADLQSCILYRTVGETAIFSVSVPTPGEYGLEVFVNDPTTDGKMLRHMCQYLIACNEHQVSGIRFPQLPAAYLGPQQAYTHLGMNTISNKDPLIHCIDGSIEVRFSTSMPLRATSNLIMTAGNKDCSEYILQQFVDNTLSFLIRLPQAGIYKFQIFAQPLSDTSDSLPGVYNYLINCAADPPRPLPFPKQFSQWKEGCYLYAPIDGDLAQAQTPQDPTPDYIFYRVSVPNASKVAVVVGGEWTHLERNPDGVWEGAAFFQNGWGREDTVALTANYGSDNASYNTLLEYRM